MTEAADIRRPGGLADPHDGLDGQRWLAGLLGDLAVLLLECRLYGAIAASRFVCRHAAVGALRAVLVDQVEQDVFRAAPRSGLFSHLSLHKWSGVASVLSQNGDGRTLRRARS